MRNDARWEVGSVKLGYVSDSLEDLNIIIDVWIFESMINENLNCLSKKWLKFDAKMISSSLYSTFHQQVDLKYFSLNSNFSNSIFNCKSHPLKLIIF